MTFLLLGVCLALGGCRRPEALNPTRYGAVTLGESPLRGDLVPVHDPALVHEGGQWYAFTTDNTFAHEVGFLQVRCSPDLRTWHRCGHVFDALPEWVRREVPEAEGLWAPEVAYFGGSYHLYYVASRLGSQRSAIGVATNRTLDAASPDYRWVDEGEVLSSKPGDPINALDPGVLVDGDQRWLVYGSFGQGILERRLDANTGKLDAGDGNVYRLAQQPGSRGRAVEGGSLIRHGGWYYLFASVGICCDLPIERDTYRQVVGRARSPHGPFVAEDGGRMMNGGGTVLVDSDAEWLAPGGGSAYVDPATGQAFLTFHALNRRNNGALTLWVEAITWRDGWPVLADISG